MWSKNKRRPTVDEHRHIERIKIMSCVVCDQPGPSDAHEIKQGDFWTSLPLCRDCHMGRNGIHGEKRAWHLRKMNELDALSVLIQRIAS
jgi:hypothetical protein